MGTFEDLGTFTGNFISRNGEFRLLDSTDVFKLSISNNGQINLNLYNISAGDHANLRLYRGTNNNGIFDFIDQKVASYFQGGNGNDVINYSATSGTYFFQVRPYASGSNDIVVPPKSSKKLFERLQQTGIDCQYHVVDGKGHFATFSDTTWLDDAIEYMDSKLGRIHNQASKSNYP